MNDPLKRHILKFLSQDLRFDGRKPLDLRKVEIVIPASANAEGSATVRMGDTEVMAGIKLSIEKPYPDTPGQGNLVVNAELLPLSSPDFEAGPPGSESIEIARVVDRCLREAGAIDLKSLCITPGEAVWTVNVDICTINAAGNLIDVSALAALVALMNARMPAHEDGAVDYKHLTDEPVPLREKPIAVTVLKIGDRFVVDPTYEEEQAIDARLTVCVTEKGHLCALQKGGDMALGIDEIDAMAGIAIDKSKELRKVIP